MHLYCVDFINECEGSSRVGIVLRHNLPRVLIHVPYSTQFKLFQQIKTYVSNRFQEISG